MVVAIVNSTQSVLIQLLRLISKINHFYLINVIK